MVKSFLVLLCSPLLVGMLMVGGLIAGLWRYPQPSRRHRIALTVAFAALYICTIPAAAWVATTLLEHWIPRANERPSDADSIVLLGAGVHPPRRPGGVTLPNRASLMRCRRAAELHHAGPPCPVLISGGKLDPNDPGEPVAVVMAAELERLGVPRDRIFIESESENTYANARLCRDVISREGWRRPVLVTSATHLPRSTALFRKQNIDVVPMGCEYFDDELEWGLFAFLPSPHAADANRDVVHELLGLLMAKLRGRI